MAYNFSLMDDEDELDAELLRDSTFRAQSLSSAPTGVQTPRTEPAMVSDRDIVQDGAHSPNKNAEWRPDVAPRDPQLMKQWKDAESAQLSRSQYDPNEYGLGEFARDNGGVLVAGLISALSKDKGRSLPSLAAGAAETNRYYENQRRTDAKNSGDFALKARAQKSSDLQDQLNIKRIQNQDRQLSQQDERIELANKGEGRRGSEFDRKYSPDNPQVQALKSAIVEASGGRVTLNKLDGLDSGGLQSMAHAYDLQYDSANTGQKARDEAIIGGARAGASANATNASEARWAPTIGAQRGVGNARAEEIERPGKVATAGATTAATTAAGNAANQGKEDTKAIDAFNEKNGRKLAILSSLDSVLKDVPEKGAAPGTGYGERAAAAVGAGGLTSQAAQDADAALTKIIMEQSADIFGANSSAKQEINNAKAILGSAMASPEQRTHQLRLFREALQADIAGASAANPKAAAAVRGARSGNGSSGTNGFGGGAKMRSPSGNVGVVPPEKIQAAKDAGWVME